MPSGVRLSDEVRRRVIRLGYEGLSYREILGRVDLAMGSVTNILRPLGGVYRQELWAEVSPHRLCLDDRIAIWRAVGEGWSYRRIGASLERPRHASTICREVNANGGRQQYRPISAEKRACLLRQRGKATKLAANPALSAAVVQRLERLWSPKQIEADLRETFGDDPAMTVSHETIYKSLYVQGRGELRKELARCLRTGRAQRRPRRQAPVVRGIRDKVMIK